MKQAINEEANESKLNLDLETPASALSVEFSTTTYYDRLRFRRGAKRANNGIEISFPSCAAVVTNHGTSLELPTSAFIPYN